MNTFGRLFVEWCAIYYWWDIHHTEDIFISNQLRYHYWEQIGLLRQGGECMTDKVSIGNNLKVGDTFEHNGKTYKVVEVKDENLKIEEVKR